MIRDVVEATVVTVVGTKVGAGMVVGFAVVVDAFVVVEAEDAGNVMIVVGASVVVVGGRTPGGKAARPRPEPTPPFACGKPFASSAETVRSRLVEAGSLLSATKANQVRAQRPSPEIASAAITFIRVGVIVGAYRISRSAMAVLTHRALELPHPTPAIGGLSGMPQAGHPSTRGSSCNPPTTWSSF
jgi:hypothetical protein